MFLCGFLIVEINFETLSFSLSLSLSLSLFVGACVCVLLQLEPEVLYKHCMNALLLKPFSFFSSDLPII